jgi:serine/threonine protein kinase/WD40 repeat protein
MAEQPNFDDVLREYMARLDRGEAVDRESFIAEHRQFERELREYFEGSEALRQLRAVIGDATEPRGDADASLGRIRYFGDYELVEELGRGGMGVVFKARQVTLNRFVAVKMISSGRLASASDVARFRREAEAAARLEHPNIVPIYEIGEEHGQHYYSMKLVEGTSLARADRPLEPKTAVAIVRALAQAVHHAHQRGILHRDLKPSNVILAADGTPFLTDFGLAKALESKAELTDTGMLVGTPSYMAPEQVQGDSRLTTAVDIWALGAILYELVTSESAFRAENALATMMKVLEQEPARPRELNGAVDRDLDTIILKCLRKDSEQRYGSAEALAEDLRRWQAGEPVAARPISGFTRFRKWIGRHPAIATLAFLTLAVSVTAALVVTNQWFKAERALYTTSILLAQRELEANNIDGANRILRSSSPLLRNLEWRLLNSFANNDTMTVDTRQPVTAVAFAPDGARVAIAQPGTLQLIDAWNGKRLALWRGGWTVQHLHFTPDGLGLLLVGDHRATLSSLSAAVLDAATLTVVRRLDLSRRDTRFISFSDDGRYVVALPVPPPDRAGEMGLVKVLEFPSGRVVADWTLPSPATEAIVAPDGHTVLIATLSAVEIRDISNPGLARWITTPYGLAGLMAVTGDEVMITGSAVRIVNWKKLTQRGFAREHEGSIRGAMLHPDGTRITIGEDRTIRLSNPFRVMPARILRGHRRPVTSMALSPDGLRLVTGSLDGTIKFWDPGSGGRNHTLQGHAGPVTGTTVSKDGRILVAGISDVGVAVWDQLRWGRPTILTGLGGHPVVLAISDDHRYVAAAGNQNKIVVWDRHRALRLHEFETEACCTTDLKFSSDGTKLAAAAGNKGYLWEVKTGHPLIFPYFPRRITRVAFSPEDSRMAVGNDVEVAACRLICSTVFRVSTPGYMDIAFAGDSRRLITAEDRLVRLWDMESGQHVLTFPSTAASVDSVQFVSQGIGSVGLANMPRATFSPADETISVVSFDPGLQRARVMRWSHRHSPWSPKAAQ